MAHHEWKGNHALDNTRDDYVASFKAHAGYDAPLIAIKDATAAGLHDKIEAARAAGLFATVGAAAAEFAAAYQLGAQLDAGPVDHPATTAAQPAAYAPPAAPAAPPATRQPAGNPNTPPGMAAPACPHGTKTYREGNGPKGPWRAWFCPARKGTPGQCPPEWL